MVTPLTEQTRNPFVTVSVYAENPQQPAAAFITRTVEWGGVRQSRAHRYLEVRPESLGRLAHVCDQAVIDGTGEVHPRRDGWLFTGRMSTNG